jgi:hypothetical protein
MRRMEEADEAEPDPEEEFMPRGGERVPAFTPDKSETGNRRMELWMS